MRQIVDEHAIPSTTYATMKNQDPMVSKQAATISPDQTVSPVQGLLTPEAIRYRREFTQHLRTLIPQVCLDCVCVSALHNDKAFCLIAPPGTGKTRLLLKLLNLEVPYSKIPFDLYKIENLETIPIQQKDESGVKAISFDMTYFGLHDGYRLALLAPFGEVAIAAWDISRHTFRMIDSHYYLGKERTPEGRKIQKAILRNLCFSLCGNIFGSPNKIYHPSLIFVISVVSQDPINFKAISVSEAKSFFKQALVNAALHRDSTFWHRNELELTASIENLVSSIHSWPKIYKIRVSRMYSVDELAENLLEGLIDMEL